MRFQRKGWAGLVDESRRPHVIHRLPEETVARVVEVRRREGWCSEALEAYLKAHVVPAPQIYPAPVTVPETTTVSLGE